MFFISPTKIEYHVPMEKIIELNKRTAKKLALVPKFQPHVNMGNDPYNRVGKNFAKPLPLRTKLPKTNIIASLKKLAIIRKNMV